MSDASSTPRQPAATDARPQYQRSAKNYLLDRRFQLKYAGLLAGIAALFSIALGGTLWKTNSEIVRLGQLTVSQGQETVRRHQQAVEQSRIASDIVKMNIAKEYKDYPELAKIFEEDATGKEDKLKAEQDQLQRDAQSLAQRAKEIEQQQLNLLRVLVVVLSLLVVVIGLAGIVFTHKVAGPIFKMKRLLRQVGEGKLIVRERLRKGDELQHFFDTFEKMVDDLRARQEAEITKLDTILEKLERGDPRAPEDGVALLKELRRDMRQQIDA